MVKRRKFGNAGFLLLHLEVVAVVLQNEVARSCEKSCKAVFLTYVFAQVGNCFIESIVFHNVAFLVAIGETELAFSLYFHLLDVYVAYINVLAHWRRQGYFDEGVCFEAFGYLLDKFFHSEFAFRMPLDISGSRLHNAPRSVSRVQSGFRNDLKSRPFHY